MIDRKTKLGMILREADKLGEANLDILLHFAQYLGSLPARPTTGLLKTKPNPPSPAKSSESAKPAGGWLGPGTDKPMTNSLKFDEDD